MPLVLPALPLIVVAIAALMIAFAAKMFVQAIIDAFSNIDIPLIGRVIRAMAKAIGRATMWVMRGALRAMRGLVLVIVRIFAVPAIAFVRFIAEVVDTLDHAWQASYYIARRLIPRVADFIRDEVRDFVRTLRTEFKQGIRVLTRTVINPVAVAASLALKTAFNAIQRITLGLESLRRWTQSLVRTRVNDAVIDVTRETTQALDRVWDEIRPLTGAVANTLPAAIAAVATATAANTAWIKTCGAPSCAATDLLRPFLNRFKGMAFDAIILALVLEMLDNPEVFARLVAGMTETTFGLLDRQIAGSIS